jgi:adenosylmethionine---8-amino-7-oxononanoate aminotransferase
VALEHLRLLDSGDVLANVTARALELEVLLTRSVAPLPAVAAVRQRGLMVGVELAPPGPGFRFGRRVCAAAVRAGVLLRPLGDVVVVMPPLTITADEIDRIVSTLAEAITEVAGAEVAGTEAR